MVNSIIDSLLQSLILVPLIILAKRTNQKSDNQLLVLALLLFVATSVANELLNIKYFEGQQWNWIGKASSLLIALVFIFVNKKIPPQQFGLTTKIELKSASKILIICVLYSVFRLVLYLKFNTETNKVHFETVLYQLTMPGFAEEVIFRGVLLTLLNNAFPNPKWLFLNVHFGWAAILTSLLFGLTHGLYFENGYHMHLDYLSILRAAFDGFLFALLIEKTKSLIPGVLFHSVLNVISNH